MKKFLFMAITALWIAGGCHKNNEEPSDTYDEGVEINGVVWATRNVGKPGTFAATREDPGMVYQWNSRVGWVCEDGEPKSSNGSEWLMIKTPANTWSKTNDPCPNGWHIPTFDEAKKLEELCYEIEDAFVNERDNDVPIPTEIENHIQMLRELFVVNKLRPGLVYMDANGCANQNEQLWVWEIEGFYWLAVSAWPPDDRNHSCQWPIIFVEGISGDGRPACALIESGHHIRLSKCEALFYRMDMPLPIRCVRD